MTTYGFEGFMEMEKHTKKCKKSQKNKYSIRCLFTTYEVRKE